MINGGADDDRIFGNSGRDRLQGSKGDDVISGGQGADIIHGNKGNDTMRGGDGRDLLRGGNGQDIYVLENARGFDTFEGFQKGTDKIRLANGLSFEDLSISVKGGNTIISLEQGDIRLAVVLDSDVSDAANFV